MNLRAYKQSILPILPKQFPPQTNISNKQIPNNNSIDQIRQLRSLSRNKRKLRMHLFKNKDLVTEDNFYSPNRQEMMKCYSTYNGFSAASTNLMTQTKTTIQTHHQREDKQSTKKSQKQSQAKPDYTDKKQKKQFKLIHQIKKQKAKKNQQKNIVRNQQSLIFNEHVDHIDRISSKKIQIFTQQLNMILKTPQSKQLIVGEDCQNAENFTLFQKQMIKYESVNQNQFDPVFEKAETVLFHRQNQKINKVGQQQFQAPDLNRSCMKAQNILKQRKNSSSSIEYSFRQSRVRDQMSFSLGLQSHAAQSRINASRFNIGKFQQDKISLTIFDRIKLHLQILQTISLFVFQSTKFDTITDEWEQLNFLIYKKFYIERVKVLNFIKKYPMKNPFNVYNAQISSKQIINFMKTDDGMKFKTLVQKQTKQIRQKLSLFYSRFDKNKVGERINLFQYDNFSRWIIQQLWAQLILTEYNASHSKQIINIRLCRILQLIFLISQLNGKYQFPFDEAEQAIKNKNYASYIKEGKQNFQKYILYKSQ